MTRAIHILTDPVSQQTADQYIRNVVLTGRKPSETNGTRKPISGHLYLALIMILVGNYRRSGPRLNAVSGREGTAAIKKLAALSFGVRSSALRAYLENIADN